MPVFPLLGIGGDERLVEWVRVERGEARPSPGLIAGW